MGCARIAQRTSSGPLTHISLSGNQYSKRQTIPGLLNTFGIEGRKEKNLTRLSIIRSINPSRRWLVAWTVGLSYKGTGLELDDPCGSLPTQDILWFMIPWSTFLSFLACTDLIIAFQRFNCVTSPVAFRTIPHLVYDYKCLPDQTTYKVFFGVTSLWSPMY